MTALPEIKPSKAYETERLVLKARSFDQAEDLFSLVDRNRQHLKTWMPWEQHTDSVEDSRGYLIRANLWWENSTTFDFSVYEKTSNQMVGSFGLHTLNWESKSCELGYWLGEEAQGKGYASECVRLGEKMALELGFHRLVITCDRLNQRSHQVAQRNGYKLEATLIDHLMDRGQIRDTVQFVKFINPPREGFLTENLPHGYAIRDCTPEEFRKLVSEEMDKIFDQKEFILRPGDLLSSQEKEDLKEINKHQQAPYQYHTVLFHEDQLAGWTWGYQDSRESVRMCNSAILDQHRGRGLYAHLLEVTLKKLISKGFQRIWSRHHLVNNRVLVPKLKRGFLITGTEINDALGTLIHLTYFASEMRRNVLKFRAGYHRPDQSIKDLFKL